MEPGANRADGKLEDLGDLLVGEALDIAQNDYDAALLGKRSDRAVERLLQLASLERLVRPRTAIGQPGERLLPVARDSALASRQPVETEARDDRVEPG